MHITAPAQTDRHHGPTTRQPSRPGRECRTHLRRLAAAATALVVAAAILSAAPPAGAQAPEAEQAVLPPSSYTASDCAGAVPIVVASDAPAQSDLYSAVTLAGVLGTECVVLAGARDEPMPQARVARLDAAASGGFIVGGTAAIPDSKVSGRSLTRLAGNDRWHTARLVGAQALIVAGGADTDAVAASAGAEDPTTDCTDDTPIMVASDAAAQSDLYSAVTLAGVIGTDCIILTGPRDGAWPEDQQERARAAGSNNVLIGYIVGGTAAVPIEKFEGFSYSFSRISGQDRWQTAQQVGDTARSIARMEPADDAAEEDDAEQEAEEEPDTPPTYTALSAGRFHTCALRTDATVACWGLDNYGQSSPPEGTFTAVSAGGWHTCALRGDNSAVCWGNNEDGQTDVPDESFTAISAGGAHTCGLLADGTIRCWGRNNKGQTDVPSVGYRSVSAGFETTCALMIDNWFQCWGRLHGLNQLDVAALSADGDAQVCVVADAGPIVCAGQIYGAGSTTIRSPTGAAFTAVSTGGNHACGIIDNDLLYCWGDNSYGQLAPIDIEPGTVSLFAGYYAVSAGHRHTCALDHDGSIDCWGHDDVGQASPPTS